MSSKSGVKKLIEESEWMRVYRIPPDTLRYEFKFLTDGLEVAADSIKQRWHSFSPKE